MILEAVPTGGVREPSEPEGTQSAGGQTFFRYSPRKESRGFRIAVPATPPEHLLLDVEASVESDVVFMSAVDLEVSVEAENAYVALAELIESIQEWLEYLREDSPRLTEELEHQRQYVALLDFEPITWFRQLLTP